VLPGRIQSELDVLRERTQLRTLDSSCLNLSSNDYLGLSTDPRIKAAAAEALAQSSRTGSTGSRLLSGNSPEWESLETRFAEFAGTEAALYFGSGYAANIGLLSSILKPGDVVFSDALNHASIIDGIRLSGASKVIYPHRDVEFLERALRERAGGDGARVIVTETIFSMEGDVAPLEDYWWLARDYGAELIVDEAHATGVWGPGGRGVAAVQDSAGKPFATVHTCGKALASAGAFICGSNTLREYLINHARTFIFSTAPPPYFAGQIRAALALAQAADREREHLRSISNSLQEGLVASGFDCGDSGTQIVPVILGSNEAAVHYASRLQAGGFGVKPIRPPTVPPGSARIRFSLTANITLDQVRDLIEAMVSARASLPEISAYTTVHG
jgi:8-amino-7-oxononanoate synthase